MKNVSIKVKEIFHDRYEEELTDQDLYDIPKNLVGFFDVLLRVERRRDDR